MKTVCRALGVARSHVHELHRRSPDWHDGRKGRTPTGDAQLLAEIRQQITDLPSYGYRRACALVNRQRSAQGGERVNPKRDWLEFLSDNGSTYIAADTRAVARSLGLKPINTPVCSPQSNGLAESFVNTFKRDYVARMDLSNAATVLAQLPAAFEHFNEVHPHSSLKMRSPREFRRHQAAQARCSPIKGTALRCE